MVAGPGSAPRAEPQATPEEKDAGEQELPPPDAGVQDAGWPVFEVGPEGNGQFNLSPPYKNAPESNVPAGAPRGSLFALTLDSKQSAIYSGVTGPFIREVTIYIPKQYVNGTAAPFMLVQDGLTYVQLLAPILDTLIFQKRLPPLVVIFANPGPGDGRGSERGLEYDRVSEDYTRFVETELLPFVLAHPRVVAAYPNLSLTPNPEGRASAGCSSGGAAAFTMGWFRPDLYRRILTYSGTFVNQHPEAAHPLGAWEYHLSLIASSQKKPLRVFLEVGENDLKLDAAAGDVYHNWVTANRAMASALEAKGYPYRFVFAGGAVHCDAGVLAQTFPETLVWLWRGYPVP